MAAQAQRALRVQGQVFNVIGMAKCRSMTALTLDAPMRTTPVGLDVIFMALGARCLSLVLTATKAYTFLTESDFENLRTTRFPSGMRN